MEWGYGSLHCSPVVRKSSPWPSASLCAQFPARALFPALAPLCAWVVVHTLKLLFSSFNNILQLISCFLADSLSKSNLWQVLIWVMTTWSTFLVGNYWVRSEQIWYPLTVSKAGIFTTCSLEIHWWWNALSFVTPLRHKKNLSVKYQKLLLYFITLA